MITGVFSVSWNNPQVNDIFERRTYDGKKIRFIIKGIEHPIETKQALLTKTENKIWVLDLNDTHKFIKKPYGEVSGFYFKGQVINGDTFAYVGSKEDFPEYFL